MAAIDLMATAYDTGFQWRTNYYMVKGAAAVMAELLTTNGHDLRVAYASRVLDGSAPVLQHAIAVLTNSTVAANGAAAPDTDIEYATNEYWNAMSGVETG